MALTKLYPMVQFKKDTWEIDEFDTVSTYLLIGTEKAMLIDCGMGIGDLRGAVEMLTDKPIIVVITHGSIDHTANCRQFEEIWIHPKEHEDGKVFPLPVEKRRDDTRRIAKRQKECIGPPYSMFRLYPYDINVDLREPGENEKMPVMHDLYDGQEFDLGGGRIVTAYECVGHAPGHMVFLDHQSRSLICGDALNYNLGVGHTSLEKTWKDLKRLDAMKDQYDGIYNGHHDFRALGAPLDPDCMPTVLKMMEDIVTTGHYWGVTVANPWGQELPLEPVCDCQEGSAADTKKTSRVTVCKGRCILSFNPERIRETDEERNEA